MDGLSQTPEQDKINALREILPEAFLSKKDLGDLGQAKPNSQVCSILRTSQHQNLQN